MAITPSNTKTIAAFFGILSAPLLHYEYRLLFTFSAVLAAILYAVSLFIDQKDNNKMQFDLKKYDHIDPPGYYIDKATGRFLCKPCLVKGVKSELSTDPNGKLYCPVCSKPVEKIVAASVSLNPASPRRLTERFKNR